ncbi:hypothetical protein [Actinoplanes utahensis]|uniref:hypothetical protein n=1 Tax=Actinoplanes utahensis TaxID=1869 RepID=UPI00126A23A6|nr:hypothetical protein [Actinoplanes utahensis]
MREILVTAAHTDSATRLGSVLDIETGLRAIVGHGAAPATGPLPDRTGEHRSVIDVVMAADIGFRIAVRDHPFFGTFAEALTLAGEIGEVAGLLVSLESAAETAALIADHLGRCACDPHLHGSDHDLMKGRVINLSNVLRQTSAVGALGVKHRRRLESPPFRTAEASFTRHLGYLWAAVQGDPQPRPGIQHAHALQQIFEGDLPTSISSLEEQMTDAMAHIRLRVDRDLGLLTPLPVRALLEQAVAHDVRETTSLKHANAGIARLNSRHDFTEADLSGVDLTRTTLEGLRWSKLTQWPSPEWHTHVAANSVEVARESSRSAPARRTNPFRCGRRGRAGARSGCGGRRGRRRGVHGGG